MKAYRILLVAAALGLAGPGLAENSNSNGSIEIAHGDFAGAERIIMAQQAQFAANPDLLYNLAAIYRQTDRSEQARGIYKRILRLPDQELLAGDRFTTSHVLAREALARLDALASR